MKWSVKHTLVSLMNDHINFPSLLILILEGLAGICRAKFNWLYHIICAGYNSLLIWTQKLKFIAPMPEQNKWCVSWENSWLWWHHRLYSGKVNVIPKKGCFWYDNDKDLKVCFSRDAGQMKTITIWLSGSLTEMHTDSRGPTLFWHLCNKSHF